jgi:hypothetical protein
VSKAFYCDAEGKKFRTDRDATDLISQGLSRGANLVVIPTSRLDEDFFHLKTRVAGEFVQKFVNYQIRLAVLGDISAHLAESGSLRDFVYECNKGHHIWFVNSAAELEQKRIQVYLKALASLRLPDATPLSSAILFGSAAKDAFTAGTSDVDLIIVLPSGVSKKDRSSLRDQVYAIEIAHGFRLPESHRKGPLQTFAERASGHAMSSFICTRDDLLSGDVARVLGLRPVEAVLVDRIVFASIMVSAITVWGEELLPRVPLPTIRRLDVFKAMFNFFNVLSMCAMGFAALPDATRYAMSTIKHSLHSCYFCYHLKTASVDEEIAFFGTRIGRNETLLELLELRRDYKRSFGFVLRCVPVLFKLHLRTVLDNSFPRVVTR